VHGTRKAFICACLHDGSQAGQGTARASKSLFGLHKKPDNPVKPG
jgi:hypothetical protein